MRIVLVIIVVLINCSSVKSQYFEVKERNKKFGLVYGDEEISGFGYDEFTYKYGDLYGVRIDKFWGLINTKGQTLIDCKYDTIRFNWGEGLIVSKNEKYGLVSEVDSIILEFKYDNIDHFYKDSIGIVKYQGKWGVLNENETFSDSESLLFRSPEIPPLFKRCEISPNQKSISKIGKKRKRKRKSQKEFNKNIESETLKSERERQKDCANKKRLEYIYGNIRYPENARVNGIQGTVVIQFIVNEFGEVINPEIVREIGGGCGQEALRVFKQMENWVPATQDGQNVSSLFVHPVKFRLE